MEKEVLTHNYDEHAMELAVSKYILPKLPITPPLRPNTELVYIGYLSINELNATVSF